MPRRLRTHSIRAALVALAVSGPIAAASAAPAHADAGTVDVVRTTAYGGTVTGPFPVPYPTTTQKAGEVCAFALRYSTVTDQVKVIRYTDARGRVSQEIYYGKLIGRFTNLSTGKNEVLDLSGDGIFTYFPDGSSRITGFGPYSIGFHPGDHPAGRELRLDGYSVVDIAANGTKTLRYANSYRNICTELS